MKIGEVIRKYRKAKELTQEELAKALGVTAPAVNKWENGNAMPDITLLAPIARLLGVSLEELLSFREELSMPEIREIVQQTDQKFQTESYEAAFQWAKAQIEQYPNCESLIHSLATMMDGNRLVREVPDSEKYDGFILNCYERLLKSSEESMRMAAADSLYGYYMRQEQYDKADECLSHFSIQNPERKRKQAVLYEKAGNLQKAYQTYEEILLADAQILSSVFHGLFLLKLREQDLEQARYYADKKKSLTRLFEMGEYNVYAADLELVQAEKDPDKTIACVQGLLDHVDSVSAFTRAPLYSHMPFQKIDPGFPEYIRQSMLEDFRSNADFAYMQDDPRWKQLLNGSR